MEVTVRYKNFETGTSDNIEENAQKKFSTLEKFGATKVEILIESTKTKTSLKARTSAKKSKFEVAEKSFKADDVYNMMDDAVKSLEQMIKRSKEKLQDKRTKKTKASKATA